MHTCNKAAKVTHNEFPHNVQAPIYGWLILLWSLDEVTMTKMVNVIPVTHCCEQKKSTSANHYGNSWLQDIPESQRKAAPKIFYLFI